MKMNMSAPGATVTTELAISSIPGKAGKYVGLDTVGAILPDVRLDITSESVVTKQGIRRTMVKAECPYRERDSVTGLKTGKTKLISGYVVVNLDYDGPIATADEASTNTTSEARNMALRAVIQALALALVPGSSAPELSERCGIGVSGVSETYRSDSPFVMASYGTLPLNDGMNLGEKII